MNLERKRYNKIKMMANKCKLLFGTSDPLEICKLLDIKLRFIHLSSGIYGFSDLERNAENFSATIFLSNALNPYAQRIVCAHELGHILLHGNERLNLFDINEQENSLPEYEANLFAIELMPQIYHSPTVEYSKLSCSGLYRYMNKKITATFLTI